MDTSTNDKNSRIKKILFKKTKLSFKERLKYGLIYFIWTTVMFPLMCINIYWLIYFVFGTIFILWLLKGQLKKV